MASTVPWQVVSASTTNSAPPRELESKIPIALPEDGNQVNGNNRLLLEDGKEEAGKKVLVDNNGKPKTGSQPRKKVSNGSLEGRSSQTAGT
ncbi:hypothetical protein GB937_005159 [Aspergillus fischeri]|nr:hypothetical protein GB937_005159 [Aspergillus fischeri]